MTSPAEPWRSRSAEEDILVALKEAGRARRELGRRLQPEALLSRLEELAGGQPEKAYVCLTGDWMRALFVVKDRDRFVGYEGGGGEVWTRHGGELDYFLAAPLGVQRLTRDDALHLLRVGGAA